MTDGKKPSRSTEKRFPPVQVAWAGRRRVARTLDGVEAALSIGDLATATGIAPDTLRIWERRYGRPEAIRLPSGHRRYTAEHVRWLRRVAEALSRGYRTGTVVRASEAELDRMLVDEEKQEEEDPEIERLLSAVADYRKLDLKAALRVAWRTTDPLTFLEETLAPLLAAVGRAWADGRLEVRHEHFTTEIVEDVLRTCRDEFEPRPNGRRVLLATLPGETHGLGLQMAALVCQASGAALHILGTDTPIAEMAQAASEWRADAVAISVSLSTGGIETDRTLSELRQLVPATVEIVIGGRGARGVRRGPRGIHHVEGLRGLQQWVDASKISAA